MLPGNVFRKIIKEYIARQYYTLSGDGFVTGVTVTFHTVPEVGRKVDWLKFREFTTLIILSIHSFIIADVELFFYMRCLLFSIVIKSALIILWQNGLTKNL